MSNTVYSKYIFAKEWVFLPLVEVNQEANKAI